MLLTILGWFWIILGIIFLIKPVWLQNRLRKKSLKKLKWTLFGLVFILGILLIKATWGHPGILAKIVMICGLLAIFKGFFFLKAKIADAVIEWFIAQPTWFFRIWAAFQIAFGFLLLNTR